MDKMNPIESDIPKARCPACEYYHPIIFVLGIRVLLCTIIKDPVYLDRVVLNKQGRLMLIKEFGLDNY